MELSFKDSQKKLIVSDSIFNHNFNEALVHLVTVAYAAGARLGTRSQKNRAEVTGSGKKPWRLKGTGRARAGSVKSPIWRSGGVTFAARPLDHSQKVNKKMYRSALKSILSELVRQDRLLILEKFSIDEPKTKLLAQKLKDMDMALENILIVTDKLDKNLLLATRNLQNVDVRNATSINPISLIASSRVVMTINAVKQIEERLT